MNILEICLSPSYGGLEIHFHDFCHWLYAQKNIGLFLVLQQGAEIDKRLSDLDCPSTKFPHIAGKLPFRLARSLAGFIDQNEIDIIHLHWKFDLPLAALSKKMAKRKVCLVHSRHMRLPHKKNDWYHQFIYKTIDKYITITEDLKRQVEKNLPISDEKIEVIYPGICSPYRLTDTEKEQLKSKFGIDQRFTLGLFGSICQEKRQLLFIKAVEILKNRGLDINAIIVGRVLSDDYNKKIQKYRSEHGLDDCINFFGFNERPTDLMQCLDVLVMPSACETFGLVLIESMYCGVPVIGSDNCGVPEIIDHGVTGLMFESDNLDSLVEVIIQLYEEPTLRNNLSQAAEKKVNNMFLVEPQYQKVLSALHSCYKTMK
jgi:glycosyltransferase involved in cell wall biosynthesis